MADPRLESGIDRHGVGKVHVRLRGLIPSLSISRGYLEVMKPRHVQL